MQTRSNKQHLKALVELYEGAAATRKTRALNKAIKECGHNYTK